MKYVLIIVALVLSAGCRSESPKESEDAVVNQARLEATGQAAPYAGATGSVAGTIRISGDPPPLLPDLAEIPVGKCFKAHERHRHLFRKAPDGALADVLVAVTEYDGEIPAPKQPVQITIEDCAFSQRTIAMMMGQKIEVLNKGPAAATPQLIGSPVPALRVAVPGGEPVSLIPHAPGKYRLVDRSHEFAFAEVFVLNYPTVTVTDVTGRFEISGIPIGDVRVSALLPLTEVTSDQKVTVRAGQTTDVQFELTFSLEDWKSSLAEEARTRREQAAARSDDAKDQSKQTGGHTQNPSGPAGSEAVPNTSAVQQ